jgi:heat shock protein HtpX
VSVASISGEGPCSGLASPSVCGIPMPKLKIVDSDALNAFATGLNQRQYSVTVTTGLLKALNDQEIEAVLGHELTHIRNGDVQLMVVAMIIAGVVGFAAELFLRLFFYSNWNFGGGRSSSRSSSSSSEDGKRGGGAIVVVVLAVALLALAWALSLVLRLALSRSRELLADAGSVELTKNPDAMTWALRKIENRGELPGATSAVMEMCVDNPRKGFADLFSTHPSVDSRVAALVKFAGGHDPGWLTLPSNRAGGPDDPTGQPDPSAPSEQIPPPPSGPWSDTNRPEGASQGPWAKPAGPWHGR